MHTTRRRLLGGLGTYAGVAALHAVLPRAARSQDDTVTARLTADLVRHASFGAKYSAGPGDVATAGWVAERLRTLGYSVAESTFEAPFFISRSTQLRSRGAVVPVIPQAPVAPTSVAGVTAPLRLVEGAVGNVRGRIALVLAPFARHAALFPDRGLGVTVRAAAEAGAAAVVVITMGPSGEAVALNAPEERPFVSVPAAVLAPKHAGPFVEAAHDGANATLVLDGDATHKPSPNVVARLVRGERWLAISTPRSGWFGCVGERGTGTAVFLELAAWAARRFPDLSVFLMNTGGHEYFFAGSHRVLHEAPPPNRTLAWAHIGATLAARDSAERDGRLVTLDTVDPSRTLMTTDAARAAAADAFRGLPGLEQPVEVRPQAGELSTFTDLGYARAFAVIGQHAWFHTVEDTLDRVDAALLTPVLRAHQRAIELLVASA